MQASDLQTLVSECCSEVLDAMYFTTVQQTTHSSEQRFVTAPDELVFSLRFVGEVQGRFGLSLHHSIARTLASNFLGEEEQDLTLLEIAEVTGELTNMLCGSVVSRIEGTKFALSHPEPFLEEQGASSGEVADILLTTFETDIGILQTWISVDAAPSTLEPDMIQLALEMR